MPLLNPVNGQNQKSFDNNKHWENPVKQIQLNAVAKGSVCVHMLAGEWGSVSEHLQCAKHFSHVRQGHMACKSKKLQTTHRMAK